MTRAASATRRGRGCRRASAVPRLPRSLRRSADAHGCRRHRLRNSRRRGLRCGRDGATRCCARATDGARPALRARLLAAAPQTSTARSVEWLRARSHLEGAARGSRGRAIGRVPGASQDEAAPTRGTASPQRAHHPTNCTVPKLRVKSDCDAGGRGEAEQQAAQPRGWRATKGDGRPQRREAHRSSIRRARQRPPTVRATAKGRRAQTSPSPSWTVLFPTKRRRTTVARGFRWLVASDDTQSRFPVAPCPDPQSSDCSSMTAVFSLSLQGPV